MKREYTAKQEKLPYKICYVRFKSATHEHGGGRNCELWHEVAPDCKTTVCHVPIVWFGGDSWRIQEVRYLNYVPSDRCMYCALRVVNKNC